MPSRNEVYEVLDGERDHQDVQWPNHRHTTYTFLTYMQDYLAEAMRVANGVGPAGDDEPTLHVVRKIAALGVACMEQNGAPRR